MGDRRDQLWSVLNLNAMIRNSVSPSVNQRKDFYQMDGNWTHGKIYDWNIDLIIPMYLKDTLYLTETNRG